MTKAPSSRRADAAGTSLLLVTPLPPPVGGIGTWAETLLDSALPQHFEVAVLDTSPPSGDALRGGNHPRFTRITSSLGLLLRARKLLREKRPELVHISSSYYWGFLRDGAIAWMSAMRGARVLMHLHGGDFGVFLSHCPAPLRRLVFATLRRCAAVIVLTRETEALLAEDLPAEVIHYLPNFVRVEHFEPSEETKAAGQPTEVLFVGWVIETKGVRELLDAACALPQVRLTLCGPIDEVFRASISAEVEELGDRLRLLGRLPHDQVRALYGQCDLFALPTHREGFPVSVLEAMAAGLPVVATPVGAIPDAIRDGQEGFLVPVGDTEVLQEKLGLLVGAPEQRREMGRAARKRVEQLFAVEIVVAELEELYRELLASDATVSS